MLTVSCEGRSDLATIFVRGKSTQAHEQGKQDGRGEWSKTCSYADRQEGNKQVERLGIKVLGRRRLMRERQYQRELQRTGAINHEKKTPCAQQQTTSCNVR